MTRTITWDGAVASRYLAILAAFAVTLALFPLAGVASADHVPEDATATDVNVERYRGTDRFGTARVIAQDAFPNSDTAVIASGQQFPDALAGSFLAGAFQAPVLLVARTTTPADTVAALNSIGATNLIVLGGVNAISNEVRAELESGDRRIVESYSGETRFETAADIATSGEDVGTWDGDNTAIVATGQAFADALVAGTISYSENFPILLTPTAALHPAADAALDSLDIDRVIIPGGPAAVSLAVETAITAKGITVTRVNVPGEDRYSTATAFADFAVDNFGYTLAEVNVATGFDFADALTAAPRAGKNLNPLILTNGTQPTPVAAATSFLRDNACEIRSLAIAGGPAAVSEANLNALVAAANACDDDTTPIEEPTPIVDPVPDPTVNETFTDAPELLSVDTVSTTATTAIVRFRFDETVEPVAAGDELAFRLYAYAPLSRSHNPPFVSFATAVTRESADTANVLADFPIEAFDLATVAAVAAVGPGAPAVRDVDGNGNTEGFAPLQSRTRGEGETLAPNLTGIGEVTVAVDNTTTVEFVFDRVVDEFASVGDLGFNLLFDDGAAQPRVESSASAEIDTDADDDNTNVVTATFAGDLTDDGDIARAFVTFGTVARSITFPTQVGSDLQTDPDNTNRQIFVNPLQSVDVTDGGTTTAPDLTAVSFDEANDQVTYTFDQAIVPVPVEVVADDDGTVPVDTSEAAENFRVYLTNGVELLGRTIAAADATSVTVQFGDTDLALGEEALDLAINGIVVGASVLDDAVRSDVALSQGNVEDEIGRDARTFAAGENAGPQLVSVETAAEVTTVTTPGDPPVVDETTAFTVTYTFDRNFSNVVDGNRFALYEADGTRTALPGDDFECAAADLETRGNTVVCTFVGADDDDAANLFANAVAGAVTWDAVEILLAEDDTRANRGGTQDAGDPVDGADTIGRTRLINHEAIVGVD